jgi:hypothetical protein
MSSVNPNILNTCNYNDNKIKKTGYFFKKINIGNNINTLEKKKKYFFNIFKNLECKIKNAKAIFLKNEKEEEYLSILNKIISEYITLSNCKNKKCLKASIDYYFELSKIIFKYNLFYDETFDKKFIKKISDYMLKVNNKLVKNVDNASYSYLWGTNNIDPELDKFRSIFEFMEKLPLLKDYLHEKGYYTEDEEAPSNIEHIKISYEAAKYFSTFFSLRYNSGFTLKKILKQTYKLPNEIPKVDGNVKQKIETFIEHEIVIPEAIYMGEIIRSKTILKAEKDSVIYLGKINDKDTFYFMDDYGSFRIQKTNTTSTTGGQKTVKKPVSKTTTKKSTTTKKPVSKTTTKKSTTKKPVKKTTTKKPTTKKTTTKKPVKKTTTKK